MRVRGLPGGGDWVPRLRATFAQAVRVVRDGGDHVLEFERLTDAQEAVGDGVTRTLDGHTLSFDYDKRAPPPAARPPRSPSPVAAQRRQREWSPSDDWDGDDDDLGYNGPPATLTKRLKSAEKEAPAPEAARLVEALPSPAMVEAPAPDEPCRECVRLLGALREHVAAQHADGPRACR